MVNSDLYNFIVTVEEMNITNAAARLFITQQTLSEQIKRLEKNYGAVFFERKPVLRITAAGERMYEYAKKVVEEENLLSKDLERLNRKRPLCIGYSGSRGATVLSLSMPELSAIFHENGISLISSSAGNLLPMLQVGDIDAFLVCSKDYPADYRCDVLCSTSFSYFCRKELFSQYCDIDTFYSMPYDKQLEIIVAVPFSTIPENYPPRKSLDAFFKEHKLFPNFVSAATSAALNFEICKSNKAGIVLPTEIISRFMHINEMDHFVTIKLKDFPDLEPLSFVSKKGSNIENADQIIRILKKHT